MILLYCNSCNGLRREYNEISISQCWIWASAPMNFNMFSFEKHSTLFSWRRSLTTKFLTSSQCNWIYRTKINQLATFPNHFHDTVVFAQCIHRQTEQTRCLRGIWAGHPTKIHLSIKDRPWTDSLEKHNWDIFSRIQDASMASGNKAKQNRQTVFKHLRF